MENIFETKIYKPLTDYEGYGKLADFCNEQQTHIIKDFGNYFALVEAPKPTQEDLLDALRWKRENDCFTIINRGIPWYARLTENQKHELANWYQAWLDITITKQIPQKPSWLK